MPSINRTSFSGDDCYHVHWEDMHGGRPIVQVCIIDAREGVSFDATVERFCLRTQDFLSHHMWLDETIPGQLLVIPPTATHEDVRSAAYGHGTIAVYARPDKRQYIIFMNHRNIGGGDFLQFYTYVFGGDHACTRALLLVPTPLVLMASIARILCRPPLQLMLGPVVDADRQTLQTRVYAAKLDLQGFDPSVAARKFHLPWLQQPGDSVLLAASRLRENSR